MSKQLFLAVVLISVSSVSASAQFHRARSESAPAPAAAPAAVPSSGNSGIGYSSGASPYGSSGGSNPYGHSGMTGGDASLYSRARDPYRFSGRVQMPDQSDPAEPPRIQTVCRGNVTTVAYCDRRGRFDFDLLSSPFGLDPMFQGMIYGYSMGGPNLSACGLRAYLPGYGSTMFSLAGRGPYDWMNIGKFMLSLADGVEGATISITTLQAPKEAKKHFEKALGLLKDKRREKAIGELELAVEEYPEYAVAWALLGELRESLQYESGVREAYERALEADSHYIRPYAPLIRLTIADGNYREAAELAERAVRLNPLTAELHFLYADANFALGNFDAAAASLERAIHSDDIAEFPQAHLLYVQVLQKLGKNFESVAQMRAFLALRPNSQAATELRAYLGNKGIKAEAPASKSEDLQ